MNDQVHWEDVTVAQEISFSEEISTQRLVVWAAASGDFYQIHYDEQFARKNGLPGVIVHGALKGMLIGRLLDELCGAAGRIVRFHVSYRGMDPVGHDLRVWARVAKKYQHEGEGRVDLEVGVCGAGGKETTPGTATIALPRRDVQEVAE